MSSGLSLVIPPQATSDPRKPQAVQAKRQQGAAAYSLVIPLACAVIPRVHSLYEDYEYFI